MQKSPEVEEAKALMNEAKEWSVWRWLTDKHRVRVAADRAVDALRAEEQRVKTSWSEELKRAYRGLNGHHDPGVLVAARRVKEAEEIAENARLEAEATFDEAERRMSAAMAREGAQKAIASWELREKAIRRAEAAARTLGRSSRSGRPAARGSGGPKFRAS